MGIVILQRLRAIIALDFLSWGSASCPNTAATTADVAEAVSGIVTTIGAMSSLDDAFMADAGPWH